MEHAVGELTFAQKDALERQTLLALPERRVVGPRAAVDVEDRRVPVAFEVLQPLELAAAAVHLSLERDRLDLPAAVCC